MDVDHGTVQPLQTLFGDAAAVPVIPIFINSVATPLGPIRRCRALGAASASSWRHWTSGCWWWDPVGCPTIRPCPPWRPRRRPRWTASCTARPMSAEQRAARQTAVIDGGPATSPTATAPLQPLNPDWDHAFLELLDTGRLADIDAWSNGWIAAQAGNSAHEVRTWVAAFAALAAAGPLSRRCSVTTGPRRT